MFFFLSSYLLCSATSLRINSHHCVTIIDIFVCWVLTNIIIIIIKRGAKDPLEGRVYLWSGTSVCTVGSHGTAEKGTSALLSFVHKEFALVKATEFLKLRNPDLRTKILETFGEKVTFP